MLLPDSKGGTNPILKKGFIDFDAFRRKDADVDFGFGIEETDTEKPLAMVFDLNEVAVGNR
jgi:hypothetical protein